MMHFAVRSHYPTTYVYTVGLVLHIVYNTVIRYYKAVFITSIFRTSLICKAVTAHCISQLLWRSPISWYSCCMLTMHVTRPPDGPISRYSTSIERVHYFMALLSAIIYAKNANRLIYMHDTTIHHGVRW